MAAYADYTFYSTVYLGTAIAQSDFSRLALRASAVIDQITFNRAVAIIDADEDLETIEAIQMATCAIAEEIQTQEKNGNLDGITGEKVGNYSVTFGANAKSARTNEEKQAKAAKLYLWNTGLLYRGFAEDEYAN